MNTKYVDRFIFDQACMTYENVNGAIIVRHRLLALSPAASAVVVAEPRQDLLKRK